MLGKFKTTTLWLALLAALALSTPSHANVTGRPHDLSLDNPKGHCINCHDLHQPKLGEGHAHNLKRANEIEVCYQCHAGSLNNYSSIDKSMPNVTSLLSRYDIRGEFSQTHIHFPRYGMDGEKNKCSYCHNPHGVFDHTSTTRKPKLLSAGPDVVTDTDDYCLVCHNGDANPPHAKFPNISVGAQYLLSRTFYKQMTHSTFFRWSTLNEPFPDTAHTYEDNPYGAGKDISCLTCHRPHGSPNDHMLKMKDDQDLCLSCHDGSKANSLTSFTTTGHGKAGIKRICQDCHFPHGTGQRHAVRNTIVDPHTMKNMTANVTGKGMNEACFACHGTAGAAGYYTGKPDYAAAVHNTSPNVHNSKDIANDYLPGECINCHEPHGKGYAKMTLDQKQVLCYDCHNQATPNTLSGKDVSAAFQGMSSAHDLSKVKCTNCHNVHKATQATHMMNPYSATATVAYKKVFCLKCHSGRMPSGVTGAPNIGAEWTNSGHDKTHVLDCGDCHDSHGSPNRNTLNYQPKSSGGWTANFARGLSFNSRAFCEACHNRTGPGYKNAKAIPTGAGYTLQHGQSDTTPCSNCHSRKHNPAMSSYTGASAYYTTYCLNCHTQGAGNPYPDTNADFNYPAGQGGQRQYTSIHQITYNPPANVDCVKCHGANHETDHSPTNKITDPDRTDNGGALDNMSSIRTSNRFCMECHDTTPVSFGSKTAPTFSAGLLPNGGFEDGTLAYWTAADGVLTALRSISLHHLGAASVSLTNWQQTCWDEYEYVDYDCTPTGYFNSAPLTVTPSATYSFSGYVDVPTWFGWGGTSLIVTEYTSAGVYVTQRASGVVSVTSGWQKLSLSWTTAPTTGKVVLGVQLNGPGTAYWDDFESSVATGGHNTSGALLCSDCHDYHKSLNRKLLRYTPKSFGGYTADFAPGKNFSTRGFCESCHNRAGTGFKGSKKIPTGADYMAQHNQSDTTPCSNCHTDKHNPSVTANYYSTACLGQYCHTQGSGNPYPDADAQMNTPGAANDANHMGSAHRVNYAPPGTVDCTVCHGSNHKADHSPEKKVVDPDPAHPTALSLDIRASSAFCLQCHATKEQGGRDILPIDRHVSHPFGLDTVNPRVAKVPAELLRADGRFECLSCHEPHSSNRYWAYLRVDTGAKGRNVRLCIGE